MATPIAGAALIDDDPGVPRGYAWIVFALVFGLLVSDYMSRQVLAAVFAYLKTEWGLTDSQLGGLSSIVALMVGLLTVPLSFLADRFGRVASLTLMAVLWSLATLGCAFARSYEEMLLARFLVGVGEAAYGSVGIAVVLSVFPARMRGTLAGAFMAGGMIGSVLGVGLGGLVAGLYGWRAAFASMAAFGLALALAFPLVVRPSKIARRTSVPPAAGAVKAPLATLVGSASVVFTYLGSGLQLFIGAALISWLPSLLNRFYGMPADKAGVQAAGFILIAGLGMIVCGRISDMVSRRHPERMASFALGICIVTFAILSIAFRLPPGPAQLGLIACGLFLTSGSAGPASALVASLTHIAVHGSAFAVLTLANNFLGLAPAPYVVGLLADRFDLMIAMQIICFVSLASGLAFAMVRICYARDVRPAAAESVVAAHA